MNSTQYEEYNNKIEQIDDPVKLQEEFAKRADEIADKSRYQTLASLVGGWGSIALFLLTGALTGWGLGVLLVVASIAGGGILASVTTGLLGRWRYGKYFRAIATQEKLIKLQNSKQLVSEKEKMRLEIKLSKDLNACVKKRLISRKEADWRLGTIKRPEILGQDTVLESKDRVRVEAQNFNQILDDFMLDTGRLMSSFAHEFDGRKGDRSPDQRFEGKLIVEAPRRGDDGVPLVDESGNPIITKCEFEVKSEKDYAKVLRGISENLKEKCENNMLAFPVTITARDIYDNPIQVDGEVASFEIGKANSSILLGDNNPLENLSKSILDNLPIAEDEDEDDLEFEQEDESDFEQVGNFEDIAVDLEEPSKIDLGEKTTQFDQHNKGASRREEPVQCR